MRTYKTKNGNGERFPHKDSLFLSFLEEQQELLSQNGQFKTSTSYHCARISIRKFLGDKDIPINNVTGELIKAYERWLKENGVSLNTISYYMRILRAAYNKAIERGISVQKFPFKNVYTGIEKTRKRAIDKDTIHQIIQLDLSGLKSLDYARDMFLFSFFTRGMAFVDIAFLKKEDISNGLLRYNRRKTGQKITVKIEQCMETIIKKYKHQTLNSPYLLPILRKDTPQNTQHQYYNAIRYYNTQLRKITNKLGLTVPLTSYVARHTWATIAKSKEIPISIISESMGHNSILTTQIYLASLEQSVLDQANEKILSDFLSFRTQ